MKRLNKGFTLVELLVVVGIMSLLIAILLPALNKARGAAVTISCLARMRELSNALQMYATENRGYCPPMMEGAINTGNYPSWAGGPCIFPIATNTPEAARATGYLSKYMGSGNLTMKYVCPTLVDQATFVNTGNHSYRYNSYIGGLPDGNYALLWKPYFIANWRYVLPYKLSQIKQSSNMIVFAEADTVATFYGTKGNSLWFRPDPASTVNGSAPYGGAFASPNSFHSLPFYAGPHNKRILNSLITGTPYPVVLSATNYAFADGSARTVQIKCDHYPLSIEGIWQRPDHPTPTW